MVRFWIGPRVGLHYLYKSESRNAYSILPTFTEILIIPYKVKIDIDAIGLDLLLAIGLNLNIEKYLTLFFDVGFGYMGNYNLNTPQTGHAFGLDCKAGFMILMTPILLKMYREKRGFKTGPEWRGSVRISPAAIP